MDRNRFKTKSSGTEDYAPAPRPRPATGQSQAMPSHRSTARPVAPRPATPIQQPRPAASSGVSVPPQPHHPPVHHLKPRTHPAASAVDQPKAIVPDTSQVIPGPQVQEPDISTGDIPELQALDPSIPSTAHSKGKRLSKRRIAEIALVLVVLSGGFLILKPEAKEELQKSGAAISGLHVNSNGAATNSTASVSGTVPFTPVTPTGKTNLANLGSSAYNTEYKSYTYDDSYMGQKIRVSQQELPAGQNSAAGLIDKIGASLKAQSVTPINIQSGQPAYILNNTSNAGSQVVVFTVKGKLVFIQAATAFDATIWPDYLNSFQ